MLKDKKLLLIIFLSFLSRILFINKLKVIMWDAAVYIMNAKWFIGEKIFFEILRPPLLPFILSFFVKAGETTLKLVSISFSVVSIILTYILAKLIFGEKSAILSSILLITLPIHIYWSPAIYTEIPSSVFILLSLIFLYKGKENVSAFFSALGFLTRYTVGILFPSILIYLLIQKKLNLKKFIIMIAIFLLTISPWIIYNQINFNDPIKSFKEGVRWIGKESQPIYFYLKNILNLFSASFIIVILGSIYSMKFVRKKEHQLLLIFLILFLTYHHLLHHKEIRYILPAIPVLVIFSSYFSEKLNLWIPISLLLILNLTQAIPDYTNCEGVIDSAKNLSGVVASTYWPQTAYYGNVATRAMPEQKNDFLDFLKTENVSYVITSSRGEWPPYASDFKFFDENLVLIKETTDKCQIYRVYKVKL